MVTPKLIPLPERSQCQLSSTISVILWKVGDIGIGLCLLSGSFGEFSDK